MVLCSNFYGIMGLGDIISRGGCTPVAGGFLPVCACVCVNVLVGSFERIIFLTLKFMSS